MVGVRAVGLRVGRRVGAMLGIGVGGSEVGGFVAPATVGAEVKRLPTKRSLLTVVPVRPLNAPLVAAVSKKLSIASTVAVGLSERSSATAPATCGVAIDVPDHEAVAVSLVEMELVIAEPGA